MLFIVSVLGFFSTAIGVSITLIYLNVIVRRESAYIIEERIAAVADRSSMWLRMHPAEVKSETGADALAQDTAFSRNEANLPAWLDNRSFSGVVLDAGRLEVRSVGRRSNPDSASPTILQVALDRRFLQNAAEAAGLKVVDTRVQPVAQYREQEGLPGEVLANFVPGSRRPVPVIITVVDWPTGTRSDWVVCHLQLNYRHTISDLSHMGLRTASWVAPVLFLSSALLVLWLAGILLSVHLSNGIVSAVDTLSKAAQTIGGGDFSIHVRVKEEGQLSELANCFNQMLEKLRSLRERERQTALLDGDLTLASEVQAFLTPTKPATMQGATVWSTSTPARRVSGDLHEVMPYSDRKAGLICADISGKGVSSALLMSHLQGLVHAHLRSPVGLPTPSALADMINRDLYAHSQQSRFATLFYAEVDLDAQTLTFVNAGHCYPILKNAHGVRLLSVGNQPLGLFPETVFEQFTVAMEYDSTLVVYTDGVTEALNIEQEEFGEERMLQSVQEFGVLGTAAEIGEALRSRILQWSSDVEQVDDATFLVLHVPSNA